MKPTHKVSVIVCTVGRAPDLDRCLCALCCQDYFNYEIIVVDNAPANPRARQIVDCFEGIFYVPEYRKEFRFARRAGAACASGDILAYIDDHCVAAPRWVSGIVSKSATLPHTASLSVLSFTSPNSAYRFPLQKCPSAWSKRHPLLKLLNMFRA